MGILRYTFPDAASANRAMDAISNQFSDLGYTHDFENHAGGSYVHQTCFIYPKGLKRSDRDDGGYDRSRQLMRYELNCEVTPPQIRLDCRTWRNRIMFEVLARNCIKLCGGELAEGQEYSRYSS